MPSAKKSKALRRRAHGLRAAKPSEYRDAIFQAWEELDKADILVNDIKMITSWVENNLGLFLRRDLAEKSFMEILNSTAHPNEIGFGVSIVFEGPHISRLEKLQLDLTESEMEGFFVLDSTSVASTAVSQKFHERLFHERLYNFVAQAVHTLLPETKSPSMVRKFLEECDLILDTAGTRVELETNVGFPWMDSNRSSPPKWIFVSKSKPKWIQPKNYLCNEISDGVTSIQANNGCNDRIRSTTYGRNKCSLAKVLDQMRDFRGDAKCQIEAMVALINEQNNSKAIGEIMILSDEIVLGILIAMKKHPKDEAVQRKGAEAMYKLGTSFQFIHRKIVRLGGLDVLTANMKTWMLDDTMFQNYALEFLQSMETLEPDFAAVCDPLVTAGAFEAVAHVLSFHGGDKAFQINAMDVLTNLAPAGNAASNVEELCNKVLDPVMSSMDRFLDCARLQECAVGLLGHVMLMHSASAGKLKDKGGHEAVLSALAAHGDCATLQARGWRALALLCMDGCFLHYLHETSVNKILNLMNKGLDNEDIQIVGSALIADAASDDDNRSLFDGKYHQIVRQLLQAMNEYRYSVKIQEFGCRALLSLVRDGDFLDWDSAEQTSDTVLVITWDIAEEILDTVLFATGLHMCNPAVLLDGAESLAYLINSPFIFVLSGGNKVPSTAGAIVEGLGSAVALEKGSQTLLRLMAALLALVAEYESAGGFLVKIILGQDTGGMSTMLGIMQAHMACEELQEVVCTFLCKATTIERNNGNQGFLERLLESGGKDAILAVIVKYPSNETIFNDGGRVFFRLRAIDDAK